VSLESFDFGVRLMVEMLRELAGPARPPGEIDTVH
jgi:hypothetical protein